MCDEVEDEGVRSCVLPLDGQVAWQLAYSAFGDEQPTLGSKRFTNDTTNPTTGTTPIPEVAFNLRYPGQYHDKESDPGCGS